MKKVLRKSLVSGCLSVFYFASRPAVAKYLFILALLIQAPFANADIFADYPTLMGQLVLVVRVSDDLGKEIQRNPELQTRRITAETAQLNQQTHFFEVFLTYKNLSVLSTPPCTVKSEVGVRETSKGSELYIKSLISVCAVQ